MLPESVEELFKESIILGFRLRLVFVWGWPWVRFIINIRFFLILAISTIFTIRFDVVKIAAAFEAEHD